MNKHDLQNSKAAYWTKTIFFLLISSFLISFASYSLISANNFTIGGASGVAILINKATAGVIPQSAVFICINAPLTVLAFFFVKRKFACLTAAHILLQTLFLTIIENAFPTFQITFAAPAEKIFAALTAGVCIGTAVALAFKIGGSTGGADIVAVIIQKKFSANSIATVIFIINAIIISSSLFVFYDNEVMIAYNLLPVILSIFESYIEARTQDSITNGFSSAIEFRIITDKPQEMANALMRELSRGVTSLPATGMYTGAEHSMLLCVISRRQVNALRRVMKSVDPTSFAVMSSVSQVVGQGFYSPEI